MKMLFGGIEAGGTKFVCGVSDEQLQIIERVSFPTTTPAETMAQVLTFFDQYQGQLQGIGVGSFGPIDIKENSATYGYITSTPKLPWQQYDFVGTLKAAYDLPIAWTTDVNAACYGEYVAGHGRDLESVIYYTIGTGVGGGAVVQGEFLAGFSHPEMGHMLMQPHPDDDFAGNCPFHHNCLEGLAAGPAIEKRLGVKAQTLAPEEPFWKIEADYLAQCVYNTTLMYAPEQIILGGGVMKQPQLLPLVKAAFLKKLQGYVAIPAIDEYLKTPALGDNAGLTGCFALAKKAANSPVPSTSVL